ncbi:MAG: type II secretion system protein M [Deltaproteobacteria bacterium]|nr:type II secretion system protein M [Deltaproteobacteria bacterium]
MKLAKREKLFIGAAAGVLVIFLVLQQLIIPFFNNKSKLAKETETLEAIIKDMDRLALEGENFAEISGSLERVISTRKEDLYTLIWREADVIGIKQIDFKPGSGKTLDGFQEDILEVQFKAITQAQLIEFLYRINKPEKFIFASGITIKHSKKEEGYLEVNITVMSYKKENPE